MEIEASRACEFDENFQVAIRILTGKAGFILQEAPCQRILDELSVAAVGVDAFHTNTENHFTWELPVIDECLDTLR